MSYGLQAAVWYLDLPRDEKFVLKAFCEHVPNTAADPIARPGLGRIAWMCDFKQVRSVRALVKKLVKRGVLELVSPAAGRRAAAYRVHLEAAQPLPKYDALAFKAERQAVDDSVDNLGATRYSPAVGGHLTLRRGSSDDPRIRKSKEKIKEAGAIALRATRTGRHPAHRAHPVNDSHEQGARNGQSRTDRRRTAR